jgi:hypothetical protein
MRNLHERYKTTKGELSLITIYSARAMRALVILLLLFLCSRTIPGTSIQSLAACITMGDEHIERAYSYSFERPFWPDTGLHAVWPDRVLYLDGELRLLHSRIFDEPDELFSADAHGFVQFTRTGTLMSSFTATGERAFEHRASAWPRLSGSANWILLYTGDQAGMAFLDRSRGRMVGGYQQLASIITAGALVDDDQNIVLGMMDGSVEKFSISENRSLWRTKAPAGRLPVIKGLASAQKGVFIVSGSQPEMYSFIDQEGKVRWSRKSTGDLRTQVMTFAGERFIVTHTANTLIILELDSKREIARLSPIASNEDRITWVSFAESPRTGMASISVSKGASTTLYRLSADGRVRSCRVINSPWAELTIPQNGGALAVAARSGLYIYRNPEGI